MPRSNLAGIVGTAAAYSWDSSFPGDLLSRVASMDRDLRAELWAPVAERVELAPLAARIDPTRQG
jgi:hypothetical protein